LFVLARPVKTTRAEVAAVVVLTTLVATGVTVTVTVLHIREDVDLLDDTMRACVMTFEEEKTVVATVVTLVDVEVLVVVSVDLDDVTTFVMADTLVDLVEVDIFTELLMLILLEDG
jgi:hypothetical protein